MKWVIPKIKDWSDPEFVRMNDALGLQLEPKHRKKWEWVTISLALEKAGVLVPGKSGIGFGVGKEPLAAYYASKGCKILATDQPETGDIKGWAKTEQYGTCLNDIYFPLCPRPDFDSRVEFKPVDMNYPPPLDPVDFMWSSCTVEHIGGLHKGLWFLLESSLFLKPGGISIHTVELNISEEFHTVDLPNLYLFRKQDIERFRKAASSFGLEFDEFDPSVGTEELDSYVQIAPYKELPVHLKIDIWGKTTTSLLIELRKHG